MALSKITLKNFTAFEELDLEFNPGINVFLGSNGVGKTHIMKILYSACQATSSEVSFSEKTVKVFKPENSSINRMVRRKATGGTAEVRIYSNDSDISMSFTTRTKKWDASVEDEEKWEKANVGLDSVFIPAKEILSNSYNLIEASKKGNVEFDDTYLDIIASAKVDISTGADNTRRKKYLSILQKINDGKVAVDNERFFLKPGNQSRLEFNLVAEGIRKIALLWQLIKNGVLEHGSILFWDEPEANINPKYIPELAEMLIQLQLDGVQVFVTTHDYFFAKYLEVKKKPDSKIEYVSFYKDTKKTIRYEISETFASLEHNDILETFRNLYIDELGV